MQFSINLGSKELTCAKKFEDQIIFFKKFNYYNSQLFVRWWRMFRATMFSPHKLIYVNIE